MLGVNRCTALAAAFLTVCVASALASCTAPQDLAAVSQYASATAQSAQSFANVAADYAASCERYRRVSLGIIETTSPQRATALVTDEPGLAAFLIANASPAPGYTMPPTQEANATSAATAGTAARPANRNDCAAAKDVSGAWNEANSAVLDYVQGLGSLAGVDAVPTPNPSPFVAGLAAAGVSSAATTAVSNLIVTIGAYFENRAREGEIASFLTAVNPHFPGSINALEQVDSDYTIRLKDEYRLTINKYNAYARRQMKIASQPYIADRLIRAKSATETSLFAINQNLRASADYGAAMEAILATHRQLYVASQRRASFNDYVKILQTTGEPVITNLADLAKAVK